MKTLIITAAIAIVLVEAPLPPKKPGQPSTSLKACKDCKFSTTNYILKMVGLGTLVSD